MGNILPTFTHEYRSYFTITFRVKPDLHQSYTIGEIKENIMDNVIACAGVDVSPTQDSFMDDMSYNANYSVMVYPDYECDTIEELIICMKSMKDEVLNCLEEWIIQ